jgi:hypothetical protein
MLMSFMILFSGLKNKGYDRIDPFKNGMAKVYKDKKIGFINIQGEEFIKCRYHYIGDFVNGLAKAMIHKKYGYINLQDEEVVPIKFDFIGPFKNNLALVKLDEHFGLINWEGTVICPIIYDEIGTFNKDGEAKVRIKRLEGKINRQGEEIIPVYKPTLIVEE